MRPILKILTAALFLTFSAYGQQSNKILPVISNSKTAKHINIPGTRLFIVPPPDFKVGASFTGLQKRDNSMFIIYDLIGGNFYTNAATFTRAEFEKKSVQVFDSKEIKVSNYPSKFIHMQGDAVSKSYSIVFGDTTFSTMIIAIYPLGDDKTGDDIVKSLNTIYYDKTKKIDPFETANFSLIEKNTKFRFSQFNANLYIYTIDGKENKDDKDAPVVLIYQMPKDREMTPESIADLMITKMLQSGLSNPEVKNVSKEKVNDYDAYQVEIYGQMQGKLTLLYYCVLTKDDKAIVVQGIAKKETGLMIEEFRTMSKSIKLK